MILILSLNLFFACSDEKIEENSEKEEKTIELNPDWYNVGFLIMDGVYNTELTAPYDIFHHTKFRDGIKAMNVFTVANTLDPITSFEGLTIQPDFDYTDSVPDIDILVVPSAENHLGSDLEDEAMLDFVRSTSANALYVTSHCDGAFVLAESGILDGFESTTFPNDIGEYRERYPHLTVHDSVLFVHHDKFITSAGGAKSFEAALYLCEYLYGKKVVDEIAEGMVIDWNLEGVPHLIVE